MSFFILAKIVHILSTMFFIGVVGFRTFIIPVLKIKYNPKSFNEINKLTGKRARAIIKVNNIFLILSGLYLFSFYLKDLNVLVHIKATLGLILALTFYIVPIIMNKFTHIKWFNTAFHHLFFTLMIITVILSQVMFNI